MTLEEVASVLREYGSAIRGDWGSIDGRRERDTLDSFASAITTPGVYTVAEIRELADICPHGGGHWTEHCYMYCAEDDE